jgi:hypothetical protein
MKVHTDVPLPLVIALAGSDEAIYDALAMLHAFDSRITFESAQCASRHAGVVALHFALLGRLGQSDLGSDDLLSGQAADQYRLILPAVTDLQEQGARLVRDAAIAAYRRGAVRQTGMFGKRGKRR